MHTLPLVLLDAMRARTLDDCLNADETMARLAAHAERLQRLQGLFAAAVPAPLRSACRVANFKAGALIIHAENGAVAAKLRQMAPTLTDQFRVKTQEITEIRIKVQPLDAAPQHPARTVGATLGETNRTKLGELAERLPEGPLRAALARFIQRAR